MHLIDKYKIKHFYLKLENADNELLKNVLKNKNFKNFYDKEFSDFIDYLNNFSYIDYNNKKLPEKKLTAKVINKHINSVLKTYDNGTSKYINFIKKNSLELYNFKNIEIINNPNFDKLFKLIRANCFDDNIYEIINNGNGEKLIKFLNKNKYFVLDTLNNKLFDDGVFELLYSNPKMGDSKLLNIFRVKLEMLPNLVKNELFEGLKYTYDKIEESRNYIAFYLDSTKSPTKQFSKDFIDNLGIEYLKKIYSKKCFYDKKEYENIFKLSDAGKYDLIKEIIDSKANFSFKNVSGANKK